MRFVRFRAWLMEMLDSLEPKLVVYEQAHNRGGAATQVLNGMTALLIEECERRGINYTSVHSATLKKSATGSGRADKKQMIIYAKSAYPDQEINDDNQADALHLLGYGMKKYNKPSTFQSGDANRGACEGGER